MKLVVLSLLYTSLSLASAKDSKQEVHILASQLAANSEAVYLQTSTSRYEQVKLQGTRAADPVRAINSDGQITLYGEPVKNEEGKEVYPKLGSFKSDQNWREAFVIVTSSGPQGNVVYNGKAFALDKKSLPEGGIQIANLTSFPVQGKIGSQELSLKANDMMAFKFADRKGEVIDVRIQYQKAGSSDWSRMVSTRWPVPENGRRVMLIYPNRKGDGAQTKTVPIRDE